MIEPLHLGALGLTQVPEHGAGIGHGPGDDLAHQLVRGIGIARRPAIGDELIEIERHLPLSS